MPSHFITLDELWLDAVTTVYDVGEKIGTATEVQGYVACLVDPTAHIMFNPVRKMSVACAAAQLLWCLDMAADSEMIDYYGHHIPQGCRYAKLHELIEVLVRKPETSLAVMRVEEKYHCTSSLQFLLRDGKLNLIATMLANDLWLSLPYDIFCFTGLQILIAEALGMKVGWYQHQVGSLRLQTCNDENAHAATKVQFDVLDGWSYKKTCTTCLRGNSRSTCTRKNITEKFVVVSAMI